MNWITDENDIFIAGNAFLVVICVLLSILLGRWFHRQHWLSSWLPESILFIALGFIVGLVVGVIAPHQAEVVRFNPDVFFFGLLPPIVFDAGYTLKKRNFFAQIGSIITFAVIGTLFSMFVFGYLLYAILPLLPQEYASLDTDDSIESLCFGAVVASTDPIATLAILSSRSLSSTDPVLYSLIFGESVLNDVISIVLYQTFALYVPEEEATGTKSHLIVNGTHVTNTTGQMLDHESFTFVSLLEALGIFCLMSLGSIVVGVSVALLCSFIFKRVKFHKHTHHELLVFMLFPFASYFLAVLLSLSGIVSLFFAAICLAHYNYYNISNSTRITSVQMSKTLAAMSETFLCCYIGITCGLQVSIPQDLEWNWPLLVLTIVLAYVSRLVMFPLSWALNMCRTHKIPFKSTVFIWFSGMRGAVAFALSLNFPGRHQPFIVPSVLTLVLFTNVVGGVLTVPMLQATGLLGAGGGATGANKARPLMKSVKDAEKEKKKKKIKKKKKTKKRSTTSSEDSEGNSLTIGDSVDSVDAADDLVDDIDDDDDDDEDDDEGDDIDDIDEGDENENNALTSSALPSASHDDGQEVPNDHDQDHGDGEDHFDYDMHHSVPLSPSASFPPPRRSTVAKNSRVSNSHPVDDDDDNDDNDDDRKGTTHDLDNSVSGAHQVRSRSTSGGSSMFGERSLAGVSITVVPPLRFRHYSKMVIWFKRIDKSLLKPLFGGKPEKKTKVRARPSYIFPTTVAASTADTASASESSSSAPIEAPMPLPTLGTPTSAGRSLGLGAAPAPSTATAAVTTTTTTAMPFFPSSYKFTPGHLGASGVGAGGSLLAQADKDRDKDPFKVTLSHIQ